MHGPKRKNALERSVPLRDRGRREMVPADSRWLSDGRGGVRCTFDSGFPRRGYGGQRGARTHLRSSSFRAFRFAMRCPGGRRSSCLAYAATLIDHRPAAAKREAIQCDNHPVDLRAIRHGTAVSTSQKRIACPKARQNRSRHRYSDPRRARRATAPERAQRPFLLDRARPVFFSGKTEKKMGGASSLDKPPAGASPPWPPFGGPNHLQAVDNRPYAPAGSDPGIRHSPAGVDLTQPAG